MSQPVYGPEELTPSPLWEALPFPTLSLPWRWQLNSAYLREGQERVLHGDAGTGNTVLPISKALRAGRKYFVTIEAIIPSGAQVTFGLTTGAQNSLAVANHIDEGYQVYGALLELPSNATGTINLVVSKTAPGGVYISMVSVREVTNQTTPHGWANAYRLSATAADGFISADGKHLLIKDENGNVVGTIGPNPDGTTGTHIWEGQVPPVPTGITTTKGTGLVNLKWTGAFAGGKQKPMDLESVEVWSSDKSFTQVTDADYIGTIDPNGGQLAVPRPVGEWYIALRSRSNAGKYSALSPTVMGESGSVLENTDLEDRLQQAEGILDALGDSFTQLSTEMNSKMGLLESNLADNDLALQNIRDTVLPGLNSELTELKTVIIPQLRDDLENLDSSALADRLDEAENKIAGLESTYNDLAANLGDLADEIGELHDTTLPALHAGQEALDVRLDEAETHLGTIAGDVLHASRLLEISTEIPTLEDGENRPVGAYWIQVNIDNEEIGYWRWTVAGWVQTSMSPVVIPNLDAGKITSGQISAARINAAELAVAIASIIELDAGRITSGEINTELLNAQEIAAAVANFITVSTDHLVAGSAAISEAVVEKLWTDVIRARKITADMVEITNGGELLYWDPMTGIGPHIVPAGATYEPYNHPTLGWGVRMIPSGASSYQQSIATFIYRSGELDDLPRISWSVMPGEKYRLSATAGSYNPSGASVDGRLRLLVQYFATDGQGFAGLEMHEIHLPDLDTDSPVTEEFILEVPENARYMAMTAMSSDHSIPGYEIFTTNMSLRRAVDASLIVEGSILAHHITASEGLWAKVLGAHKITADEINVNVLAAALATVIELDAERIVSGTIATSRLDAQSVAAAIASFISVTTDQITAGDASIDTALVNKLWAEVVNSRKITAEMIEVAGPPNLIPGTWGNHPEYGSGQPELEGFDPIVRWQSGAGWVPPGDGLTGCFQMPAGHLTINPIFDPNPIFEVSEGEAYLIEMWIRTAAADPPGSRFYLELRDQDGNHIPASAYIGKIGGSGNYPIANAEVPNKWTKWEIQFNPPAGVESVYFAGWYFNHANGTHQDAQVGFNIRMRNMKESTLLVDGGVTARHITASEAMWAKVLGAHKINAGEIDADSVRTAVLIAGSIKANMLDIDSTNSSTGRRMTLRSDGMRLYDGEGDSDPAIAISTTGKNYVSITDGGVTVAGMDDEGTVTGKVISASDTLLLEGQDVLEMLDYSAGGGITWGDQDVRGRQAALGTDNDGTGRVELMELSWDIVQGRTYMIYLHPLSIYCPPDAYVRVMAYYTTAAGTATPASPTWNSPTLGVGYFASTRTFGSGRTMVPMGGSINWTATVTGSIRMLVTAEGNFPANSTNTGNLLIFNSPLGGYARVNVFDMGVRDISGNMAVNRTRVLNGQGSSPAAPTPPPAKKTYNVTLNSTNAETYRGNGSRATGYIWEGKVGQGAYGTVTAGSLRGMWLFPTSITTTLNGATVNKVELYVKNEHTYGSAGATGYFHTHGHTSLPSTYTAGTSNQFSSKFSRGQGKWITLSAAVGTGLKSGAVRGIGMYTTGTSNYGFWARAAKLRITYTK